ncbi:MAG TPA: DNA alkylation repair protein [Bryobacteraceae bacterium]|nr:DNA alkylation repair protein [Bryobacteraceae bacterium]
MRPEIARQAATVRERLKAAVDPKFREGQFAFFKEEVDTYGVRKPALSGIIRDLFHTIRDWPPEARDELYRELWRSGKLEEGAIVCHVARRFPREFGGRRFPIFEEWIDKYVHNWAHCDAVASWLLAGCIAEEPALMKKLEPWTRSENRWKRRAAAVALLQEAKAGRATNQILRIASMLAEDPDVMVQKGVGWLLKEAYPAQPVDIVMFLHWQRDRFSRLTLRYAAEKMTDTHRRMLLRPSSITKPTAVRA